MGNASQIVAPALRFVTTAEKDTGVFIDFARLLLCFISFPFSTGHYHFNNKRNGTPRKRTVDSASLVTPKKI